MALHYLSRTEALAKFGFDSDWEFYDFVQAD